MQQFSAFLYTNRKYTLAPKVRIRGKKGTHSQPHTPKLSTEVKIRAKKDTDRNAVDETRSVCLFIQFYLLALFVLISVYFSVVCYKTIQSASIV